MKYYAYRTVEYNLINCKLSWSSGNKTFIPQPPCTKQTPFLPFGGKVALWDVKRFKFPSSDSRNSGTGRVGKVSFSVLPFVYCQSTLQQTEYIYHPFLPASWTLCRPFLHSCSSDSNEKMLCLNIFLVKLPDCGSFIIEEEELVSCKGAVQSVTMNGDGQHHYTWKEQLIIHGLSHNCCKSGESRSNGLE